MRRFFSLALASLAGFVIAAGSASAADKPVVVIETSLGNITVELESEKAPKTVANFLKYVDKEFYNGTVFHRVIPTFMIQGGGMTADLREKKTEKPVANESPVFNSKGMSNLRGTIAMARTGDPNSATSQFFINLFDKNKNLDDYAGAGYTAFGHVIEGMDVVDKIAKVETGDGVITDDRGLRSETSDIPTKPVVIKSIKRKVMVKAVK